MNLSEISSQDFLMELKRRLKSGEIISKVDEDFSTLTYWTFLLDTEKTIRITVGEHSIEID